MDADVDEAILDHDVVTPGAAQSADRPRVDDGAIGGRAEHEPVFRRSRRCESRLIALVNDAHEDEPGADLAPAHQGPPPIHAVATLDDCGPSRGTRAVGEDHARVRKDLPGNLPR